MYQKKMKKDAAVSPVVGVMLMLVVTIIVAAVVSGMAGGLLTTDKTTPTIASTATVSATNGLTYTVNGVSEAVSPSDLQITLSMMKNNDYLSRVLEPTSNNPLVAGTTLSFQSAATLRTSNPTDRDLNITTMTIGDTAWNEVVKDYAAVNAWQNVSDYSYGAANWTYKGEVLNDYQVPIASWTKVQLGKLYPQGSEITTAPLPFYFYMVEMNYQFELSKNNGKITEYDLYELVAGDKVDVNIIHLPTGKPIFTKTITVGL